MQYVIIGYDGEDVGAGDRRAKARASHLASLEKLTASGKVRYAVALQSEAGTMVGSALVVDFADRARLNEWLEEEPYVVGDVWKKIDVQQCVVSPLFLGLHR